MHLKSLSLRKYNSAFFKAEKIFIHLSKTFFPWELIHKDPLFYKWFLRVVSLQKSYILVHNAFKFLECEYSIILKWGFGWFYFFWKWRRLKNMNAVLFLAKFSIPEPERGKEQHFSMKVAIVTSVHGTTYPLFYDAFFLDSVILSILSFSRDIS